MSVFYNYEDLKPLKFKKRECSDWIRKVIEEERFVLGDISFIFCSDNYLLQINKEYLKHDYFTDVITFDYVDGKMINGDIFVSIDRVRDNAKLHKQIFDVELKRVIIHGVLHLLGYKDKKLKDKTLMTEKEDFYLKRFIKF